MDTKTFTHRVLEEYSHFSDDRLQTITQAFIKHIHAFICEAQITNEEWQMIWQSLMETAYFCSKTDRNEFLLFADVIGMSQLVEIINNQRPGEAVGSALVGPYYRANAPIRELGTPIMSDITVGERVIIEGTVYDDHGNPIPHAMLDVWQAATNGLYDIQDPNQPRMNLRGKFKANEKGHYSLIAILPTPYPAPTDGPVGTFLHAANRQVMRPAHIHFIVSAPKFKTLVTQVFESGDPLIKKDVVFTADSNMIGDFKQEGDHYHLHYDFELIPGKSTYPEAPIKD